MHALIVDDHDFVCEGLKSTLLIHYSEINISTASSGESDQKILKTENIDIAILDLFMPGAGGGGQFYRVGVPQVSAIDGGGKIGL